MSRKLLIPVLSVLLLVFGWIAFRFLMPSENGKVHVQKISEKSTAIGAVCNWSGFVLHKKLGVLQVFVSCDVTSALKDLTISNQEQLIQEITKKVVEPLLSVSPEDRNVLVTFIAPVQKEVVACVDVKEKQVTGSSYDSFENYCWPK
jgi:hypothetical protein